MALNPVQFAEHANEQFLRYQLTAFPLSDPDLFAQARGMLAGRVSSPLSRGPYVPLSRAFSFGPLLADLATQGTIHPALAGLAPYSTLFAHQYEAPQAAQAGRDRVATMDAAEPGTEAELARTRRGGSRLRPPTRRETSGCYEGCLRANRRGCSDVR